MSEAAVAYEIETAAPGAVVGKGAFFSPFLASRWIRFLDAKPRTVEAYERSLRPFFKFIKENGITQPTREDILSYRQHLAETGHRPTTIQAYVAVLRLFFRWTAEEGFYRNVADHVKGAKLDREHKRDYLTADQVKRLLGSVDRTTASGVRDYALLALVVTGGLRTIEVARANIEDLRTVADFSALYIQGKGRDEKTEYIRLDGHAETALREYLKTRGPVDPSAPLFSSFSHNGVGSRLTTRAISGIIKGYLIKAGFNSSRLTAHSLRHTAATLSLLAGKPLEEVQQFLRHADISTTMIYNHALDKAANGCSRAVGAAIFG